jgi:hypothetical protein
MLPPDEQAVPEKLNLEAISAGPAIENASDDSDDCTTLEQLDILKGKAELDSFISDTGARKEYARKIFGLTCLWVGGIYLLLLFQGFHYNEFRLSDNVMLAAIGSTTGNIIGVFLIVTRYFFPKK